MHSLNSNRKERRALGQPASLVSDVGRWCIIFGTVFLVQHIYGSYMSEEVVTWRDVANCYFLGLALTVAGEIFSGACELIEFSLGFISRKYHGE